MSATPRTDEAELTFLDIQNGHGTSPYVSAGVARELERELGRAKASLATLVGVVAERDRLRAALREIAFDAERLVHPAEIVAKARNAAERT